MTRPRRAAAWRPQGTEVPAQWEGSVSSIAPYLGYCHPGWQWPGPDLHCTGLASTDWKSRLAVQKLSFKHKPKPGAKSSNSTELSNHVGAEGENYYQKMTGKSWTEPNPLTQPPINAGYALQKYITWCSTKKEPHSTRDPNFTQPADTRPRC